MKAIESFPPNRSPSMNPESVIVAWEFPRSPVRHLENSKVDIWTLGRRSSLGKSRSVHVETVIIFVATSEGEPVLTVSTCLEKKLDLGETLLDPGIKRFDLGKCTSHPSGKPLNFGI